MRSYRDTEPYRKAIRKRAVWVEPLFAEAKDWHGSRRFRLRTLEKVNAEALLIAAGQNVKRLLTFGEQRTEATGTGGRPAPASSPPIRVVWRSEASREMLSASSEGFSTRCTLPRTPVHKPRICFAVIAASSCFATLPSYADSGKRVQMLYRVAFKSANLIKISLVTAAAMLAICLLALVRTTNEAEATALPENGKIVFARQTTDAGGIYTVDPDGSSFSLVAKDAAEPAWSPDGTKIAYNSFAQIWVMDADGSNKRKLPIRSKGTGFASPTWSADGTQLAFSTSQPMQSIIPGIYTIDTDGSDLTNLTKSSEVEGSVPDFSPNGLQICFEGGNPKLGYGVYVMNADGSNPTHLAGTSNGTNDATEAADFCDWSPDGTKIAYSYRPESRGGEWPIDVYVMNADGSAKINLTKSPGVDDEYPNWSPDGTKITFSSDGDIYTMDADGTDVAQITNSPGYEYSPDWQPLPGTTVPQPDTGGPSVLLVASALLFSAGSLLYAMVRRSI